LAAAFWPGPLTLVLEALPVGLALPSASEGKLAVRVPAHPALQEAIALSGGAWCSTSANLSGSAALTDRDAAARPFAGQVDLILVGGKAPGTESTVADATGAAPLILREGALTAAALAAAVPAPGAGRR